ncbi:MAG: RNA polymerase sigma-70 factor (ECF subfamily) [Planctomycetota bacterium]|jgi:RNA polymerase sigma-70 factor (ECF subfamily)
MLIGASRPGISILLLPAVTPSSLASITRGMGDKKLDKLFQRFRSKSDVAALGELFDRASPELMRVSRHLCRDTNEAEDVVQATFLTALSKSASYDPSRRVLPWLLGILALHAREARRKAGRFPDPDRIFERSTQDPIDAASDTEFQASVSRAVQGLPDTYRGVLFAHLAEGKGPREVADQFDLTPVAARVRLHRGLKLLRKTLPAGYAVATAAIVTSSRGMAAVRTNVIEAALESAGLPPSGIAVSSASLKTSSAVSKWALGMATAIPAVFMITRALNSDGIGAQDAEVESASMATSTDTDGDLAIEMLLSADEGFLSGLHDDSADRTDRSSASDALQLRHVTGRLVDADTGLPIAGAVLRFWPEDAQFPAQPFARIDSDAEGRFDAPAVPERAALLVTAEGFAGARLTLGLPALPAVPAGEEGTTDVVEDLGDVQMAHGAEPKGRVFAQDGLPAAGAELIAAAPFLDWYGQPRILQEVGRSGQDGWWRLTAPLPFSASRYANVKSMSVGECHYWLLASNATGLGLAEVLVREKDAAPAAGLGNEEEEEEAADNEIRIDLEPSQPLNVRVVDSTGARIPNVRLWIEPLSLRAFFIDRPRDAVPDLHPALARHLKDRTDIRGQASFDHLPMSTGLNSPWSQMTIFAVGENMSMTSHALTESDRASGEVELVLRGSMRQMLRGEVLTPHGEGIERASIWIGEQEPVHTDESGTFEFYANLWEFENSDRVMEVAADGYQNFRITIGPAAFDGFFSISLVADLDATSFDSLRGSLKAPDGSPRIGMEVVLDSAHSARSTWKTSDGFFELQRSGAGEHRLRVMTSMDTGEYAAPVLIPPGMNDVVIELSEVQMQPTQLLAQVMLARSMQSFDPDRAVLLSKVDGSPAPVELVLGVGHVRATELPVGEWRLWVGRHGAGIGIIDISVPAGITRVDTNIIVEPPGALEGRLRRHPGAEECKRIFARRLGETVPSELRAEGWAGYRSQLSIELDTDGRFAVQDLIPGTYELSAGPHGSRGRYLIEVQSGLRAHATWNSRPTSELHFDLSQLAGEGGILLEIEHEDGDVFSLPFMDWHALEDQASASDSEIDASDAPGLRLELPCGDLTWNIVFPENDFRDSSARWHTDASGAVTLAAGTAEHVQVN